MTWSATSAIVGSPAVAIAMTSGAARADLLQVRLQLVGDVRRGRDADDGRLLVEQGDRAVLHLTRGVRLGRDVGDLLELQRPLQAHRNADVTPEVEEEGLVLIALGDGLDRRRLPSRQAASFCGSARTSSISAGRSASAMTSRASPSRSARRYRSRHLGGERLRRRDAHLDAGVRVEHGVDLARDLRARRVGDRQRAGPEPPGEPDRCERVRCLAGLRDRDHERVARRRTGCGSATRWRPRRRTGRAPTPRARSARRGPRGRRSRTRRSRSAGPAVAVASRRERQPRRDR